MARWRLQSAHYLFTDPATEWEQKETSRETGRQVTVRHKVPRYLEPKDPADWTEGEDIVVCNGKNPQRRDIIFLGDPTPEMEPIDGEAKAITQKFIDSGKWRRPEEGTLHGESLVKEFLAAMQSVQVAPPISAASIDPAAFAKLQEQVAALVAQNAKLQAQLASKA